MRSQSKSKKAGSTRGSKSSAADKGQGSRAQKDSGDESGGEGGGLAGMSLSVHELGKQRELRAKKAERAAKEARRGQSHGGSKRPPSATTTQLQGNSNFLLNELGITKQPKRRH